jgi:transposase-like protein
MDYNALSRIETISRFEVVDMARRLSPADIDHLIKEYRSGRSAQDLARELGIHECTVYDRLRIAGVPVRHKAPDIDDFEIARLYSAGASIHAIAKQFGCSSWPIKRAISRSGVPIRGRLEQMRLDSQMIAPDVIARYEAGETSADIAESKGVSTTKITGILKQHGISVRSRRIDLPPNDVCKRYLGGESSNSIANSFGVTMKVVVRILSENGVELRDPRTATIDVDEAISMFRSGIGVAGIAKRLGTSPNVVSLRLKDAGVSLRNRSQQQSARMQRATEPERRALAKAAHEAAKGREKTMAEKCQAAQTCQLRGSRRRSPNEDLMAALLRERGIDTVPQMAIGPYNCDLAAHPVAVEIFGGNWHFFGQHAARAEERFRYIMDAGWDILAIVINKRFPLNAAVADYVATEINEARRNPAEARQYRVVWGAGEISTGGSADDDHFSIEPPFTNARDRATGQYKRVPR